MGKIAFVFSGQGDQFPGMGKELYEKYPVAASVYNICDSIRSGTSAQCFEGTEEELKETKNTQPCLFTMEMAAASVLLDKGIKPDFTAGFSLGEVTAAAFSGIFGLKNGFELVCKRGELMQAESEKFDTLMAAVIKLSAEEVERICEKYSYVYPVNYNCPGQISVSGLSSQMAYFFADIKAAGGRAIPLKVKGAFHSPFMKDAASGFEKELLRYEFKKPWARVYSNMTAKAYTEDVITLLSKQICSPVRWESLIRNMIDEGADTFIEIGPGKTLSNMIKKINTDITVLTYIEYLTEAE